MSNQTKSRGHARACKHRRLSGQKRQVQVQRESWELSQARNVIILQASKGKGNLLLPSRHRSQALLSLHPGCSDLRALYVVLSRRPSEPITLGQTPARMACLALLQSAHHRGKLCAPRAIEERPLSRPPSLIHNCPRTGPSTRRRTNHVGVKCCSAAANCRFASRSGTRGCSNTDFPLPLAFI